MRHASSPSARPPESPRHFPRLHLTESWERLGGVETLVKLMARHDPASAVISLLDCGGKNERQLFRLRRNFLASAVAGRERLRQPPLSADVLVFHNYSGLAMLGGSLAHERAVLYLHTNSADIFELLPRRLDFLDAIIASGHSLAAELKARFPQSRVPVIPLEYPLGELFFAAAPVEKRGGLTLGYSGRLETEQKQAGRLVELCAALDGQKINYRLEIAGAGSEEARLRQQLAGKPVKFLGRLDEAQMAAAYGRWDFLACTSDYETGPLVALEAMAAGVTPILPDIPCQATALLRGNGLATYAPGNLTAAATLIGELARREDKKKSAEKVRRLVADRTPEKFMASFGAELEKIRQAPGRAQRMEIPRGLIEWLPFAVRSRLPGKNFFLR